MRNAVAEAAGFLTSLVHGSIKVGMRATTRRGHPCGHAIRGSHMGAIDKHLASKRDASGGHVNACSGVLHLVHFWERVSQ